MACLTEKSIFLAALEIETACEREAFLAAACAGNPRLRSEVEELLRAHERPDHVLDNPPGAIRHWLGQLESDSMPAADSTGPVAESVGTVIGPYRLREQLGEGGMGLVFVAEQQHPVRRLVALKVIKPGMDSREVIARFEGERQALALMDHPNIARVFDAGATAKGRPYFVMELVRGTPITDFCNQSQLDLYSRLELFLAVCHAVQHAHQKGIIHRDLKPSNVLVTLQDGNPVPKVIDFGIAKAIGREPTEWTIHTCFTQVIGTPPYMSPEQAEGTSLDIDTRSDIYSLGVLLYELLTGTTPFERQRLQRAGLDELRRILREEEPPRPSSWLLRRRNAGCGEQQRGVLLSASQVRHLQDLDWIVMKALEKDRARRYETAAAFAADLRRLLREEPIEARPPSALYRFHKFARRHRVALTTVTLVAAALVLGSALSIWQAVRASASRAEAEELRKKAEEFVAQLKAANILLDSARAHADEERWATAHAQFTQAAELQPDHHLVWSGRGSLYVRLRLWKLAAADYAKALTLGAPANNPAWWGTPQLFAYTGDQNSYREVCSQLLQQLERASDSFSPAVGIRSCLVSSVPAADPADLARRAERLLRELPPPTGFVWFGGRQPPFRPDPAALGPGLTPRPLRGAMWLPRSLALYVAGLAHYRAGDHELAIQRLRESLTAEPGFPGRSLSYPALAMALHRAGQIADAEAALAAAGRAIDRWTEDILRGPLGWLPVPWFDWLELLHLYREAHLLLKGLAPPDDPRLETITRQAATALEPE